MKKILFVVFCFSVAHFVFAQTPVLDVAVEPYNMGRPENGPNGKRFVNSFIGMHFVLPTETNDAAPVKPLSTGFRFGIMNKFRFNDFFSIGYLLDFNSYNFNYSQSAKKTFPDTLIHKTQNIGLASIGTGLYFRFNFDVRRGDYLGHYLDLGAYADWLPFRNLYYNDKIDFGQIQHSRISRLNFVEKYQYGLFAAVGLNRFTIFGRYRISDVIKSPYHSAELPRLTIGVGLCLF